VDKRIGSLLVQRMTLSTTNYKFDKFEAFLGKLSTTDDVDKRIGSLLVQRMTVSTTNYKFDKFEAFLGK
jgi:hypothetical protein